MSDSSWTPGELLSINALAGETVTYHQSSYALFVVTRLQGVFFAPSLGDVVQFTKNITGFASNQVTDASLVVWSFNIECWILISGEDDLIVDNIGTSDVQGFATGFWVAPAS